MKTFDASKPGAVTPALRQSGRRGVRAPLRLSFQSRGLSSRPAAARAETEHADLSGAGNFRSSACDGLCVVVTAI
jgi:hypothetical protein